MSDLDHKALKERWAALIKEREESGLTIKEWCKERNVKESKYYYWLKTLRRDGADATGQDTGIPPFVELPVIFQEQGLQPGSCDFYPERGYFHREALLQKLWRL